MQAPSNQFKLRLFFLFNCNLVKKGSLFFCHFDRKEKLTVPSLSLAERERLTVPSTAHQKKVPHQRQI